MPSKPPKKASPPRQKRSPPVTSGPMRRLPGRRPHLDRNDRLLSLPRMMQRCQNAYVGPDRHRLDRHLPIPLVFEPRPRSYRMAEIKVIILPQIQMILFLWRYRHPVLPPDVELRHLLRDRPQLRFLHRSMLTPSVRRFNLPKILQEYLL